MVECLSFELCLSWSPDQHFLNPQSLTNHLDVILLGLFSSIKFGPSAMNTIETIKNVNTNWSIMNAAIRLFLLELRNVNSVVCSVIVVVF